MSSIEKTLGDVDPSENAVNEIAELLPLEIPVVFLTGFGDLFGDAANISHPATGLARNHTPCGLNTSSGQICIGHTIDAVGNIITHDSFASFRAIEVAIPELAEKNIATVSET